jgi:hypothetical protein
MRTNFGPPLSPLIAVEKKEAAMLQGSTSSRTSTHPTLLQRVSDALDLLGCENLRARGAGPHVVLAFSGSPPYARLTPLGGASYGLAFRAIEAPGAHTGAWEPLLLVDDLLSVIEHALVAVEHGGAVLDGAPHETAGRSRSAM